MTTALFHFVLIIAAFAAAGLCVRLTLASARRRARLRRDRLRQDLVAAPHGFEVDAECSSIRFQHGELEVMARTEEFRYRAFRASGEGMEDVEASVVRAWISTASKQPDFVLARAAVQLPPTKVLPETRVPATWGVAYRAYASAPERLGAWMQAHPSLDQMGYGKVIELSVDAGLASVVVEGELTRPDDLIRLADLLRACWAGAPLQPTVPPAPLDMGDAAYGRSAAFALATMGAAFLCIPLLGGRVGELLQEVICLGAPMSTLEVPALALLAQLMVAYALVFCLILLIYVGATWSQPGPAAKTTRSDRREGATPYR